MICWHFVQLFVWFQHEDNMPKSKPATTQRSNRAHRIAYLADIQRIIYTITLTAFIHSWALAVISRLIPSAYTALLFLAALHRSGRQGYIGCAVAYDLLAPQIVKATGRKCKVRTLERGLAFLKKLGLVELRPWTMPDQTIRSGDRLITVRGTARVELTGGRWCTRQLRIIVLTDRAVALWDKLTGSQGDRHIAHYPPPAILAGNSPIDQIDKSITVESKSSNRVTSDCPQPNDQQGRPTPPVSSPMSSQTVEHETLNPQQPLEPAGPAPAPRGASSDPPVSSKMSPKAQTMGCSRLRPKIPRKADIKLTWSHSRLYILSELHKALERFSTRQADAIYDRAKFELSRNYPAGWPTTCDWPYWIGRFPNFSQSQRRYHTMRDILPLLKHPAAITPHEPRRYREGKKAPAGSGELERAGDRMADFLKKFSNKFCEDD